MKRLLMLFALGFLFADAASAEGEPRLVEEGAIRVRFYFDQHFHKNQLFRYHALAADLFDALARLGRYQLGVRFELDGSSYQSVLDMGSRQIWSREQSAAWLDQNMVAEAGLVKVLIHARAMTVDGECHDVVDEGRTWYAKAAGRVSSRIVLTTRLGCGTKDLELIQQVNLKSTFLYEMSRALGHDGVTMVRWSNDDVANVRQALLGPKATSQPVVACHEFADRDACVDSCRTVASFPDEPAIITFDNCVRSRCSRICD